MLALQNVDCYMTAALLKLTATFFVLTAVANQARARAEIEDRVLETTAEDLRVGTEDSQYQVVQRATQRK